MKALLAWLCALASASAWAGEVKEAPLDEPPPPAGTHKLNAGEAAARAKGLSNRVAIFSVPAGGELQPALEAALAQRGAQLVDLAALFPAPKPAPPEHAEELYKKGRASYDDLDSDTAAKYFAEAVRVYEAHAAETPPASLARVLLFLGAARSLNGNAQGAQDAFERAASLDPSVKPDAQLFGQDVLAAFEKAREALRARPAGSLSVTSSPPGAEVLLDGERKGQTPLAALPVSAGEHPVLVRLPGYLPHGTLQRIHESREDHLQAELQPTPGLAAADAAATKLESAAEGAAGREAKAVSDRVGGARFIVVISARSSAVRAWDVATGNRLTGVAVSDAASVGPAADQLEQWMEAPPATASSGRAPGVVKHWWLWAGAGIVAAAVVTGAAVASSSGHPHSVFPGGVPY